MRKTGQGSVRIIAGTLKGSKLPILDSEGLRPTSNRVRETVFNWMQHSIQGKRVLDLFSGSGALGFEAVSRQAQWVTMLEKNADAVAVLLASKQRLNINNIDLIHTDSIKWLGQYTGPPFELVFLDPPYAKDYWSQIWPLLRPNLADQALIYIEHIFQQSFSWPIELHIIKQGKTRQSRFFLGQWHKTMLG
jgi:16S rRNA (guanine966-N2)-methyltransferase